MASRSVGQCAALFARPSVSPPRRRPCGSGVRPCPRPDIRVCGGERDEGREFGPGRVRGGRSVPWPGRRSSGPRASRRPTMRAGRRRPGRLRRRRRPGWNAAAIRLPRVIVPVLSSSRCLTSPAASTARPLIASTLRWTRRSIPAMPIADSRAPMVVGIRHTSSATSTTTDSRVPDGSCRKAEATTTAGMKMIVSAASRMVSATSLGVFCRFAPSTRLIIRSRNVCPGWAVMRMTMRSESTRVPPVTAERSPPDSRITGADSPVIADSSTWRCSRGFRHRTG